MLKECCNPYCGIGIVVADKDNWIWRSEINYLERHESNGLT